MLNATAHNCLITTAHNYSQLLSTANRSLQPLKQTGPKYISYALFGFKEMRYKASWKEKKIRRKKKLRKSPFLSLV